MLKNYFKIAFRNIRRHKTYSILNLTGLGVGMACAILIMLWIGHELSYDRFHANAAQIYRVVGNDAIVKKIAVTCGPLAETLKNDYPDIVNSTRYMPYSGSPFKYKGKTLNEDKGAFADPAFLEMFSFKSINGNLLTALSNPSDIVITQTMAKRFFGTEDPIGKALLVNGSSPMVVSAVVEDPPSNSQLQFNFLMNILVLKYIGFPFDNWSNAGLHTFVQVKKNTDIRKLNAQIADLMPKHIPGFARKLFLQPLTDIHLGADYIGDLPGLGDMKYIYIFSAIGLFLILIACINYINLSTARVLDRSREVGMRKIVGSSKAQLINYFLIESGIYVLVAALIALALVELFLPEFSRLSGTNLVTRYAGANLWLGLIVTACITCLLAGVYPALRLSSLKPIAALKDHSIPGRGGVLSRKTLVVVQFGLSIILIAGTAIVYQQLNYIRNKKLGFDKSNIIYFQAKGKFLRNYDMMKSDLLSHSSIADVTAEDKLLLNAANSTENLDWEGKSNKTYVNAEYSFVDRNYFKMLDVRMKEGRNFSPNAGADRDAYILNEEAVKQMGIESPLGKRFSLNNKPGVIIGVIKDVNFKSLHQRITPSVYSVLGDYSGLSFTYNGTILVKTAAGKNGDAIASISKIWKEVNPDLPFEYHFLDESIDKQYLKENQTGEIFGVFSAMAILISCLGLYGLTSYVTENRTKEIGIRKVLGASVLNIVTMLYGDFAKWILLSNIIAWPVAWYAMNKWLQAFAYHIDLGLWVFGLAGIIALVIAIGTMSVRAIRAATANPVESLRYE